MNNTVLFGQSYFLRFDAKLWRTMQPYPPLGTLYAAAYLRAKGYTVALFDAMLAESEQNWTTALQSYNPRFAVLFEDNFNYLSKMCLLRMRSAAFKMISSAKQMGSTIIISGSDASDHFRAYLEAGADFVIRGEGEITLGDLLDTLTGKKGTSLEDIPGLAFFPNKTLLEPVQERSDEPILTQPRQDNTNLDGLPFPAWDLVDIEKYRSIWKQHQGYFSMNMVTTRGCPFHCNWCAKPIWGQRYNVRSPENVIAELRWLRDTYHPDHIWFADDIIGLKPGWLEQFADLLEEEKIRIPFKCLSRVDLLLREETIPALARAGAQIVWVGAESGSQKILDAMEKGTTIEQIKSAARKLREHGIQVGFFLQFGYPGETQADIGRTIQMVRSAMPDDIGISVSYPLPGTRFYSRVQEQLNEQQNWVDSSDLAMLYDGPSSTAYYRQLHTRIHREFRLRKNLMRSLQMLTGNVPMNRQFFRCTLTAIYQTLNLPLDIWRLHRLAQQEQPGRRALHGDMSHLSAATPSEQSHE